MRKPDVTANDTASHIQKIHQGLKFGTCFYWVISQSHNPVLIGTICLWNFDEKKTRADVGYELLPTYAGKGLVSEALAAVILFAKQRGFKNLQAFAHPKNVASQRVLTKNGFEQSENNGDETGYLLYRRSL